MGLLDGILGMSPGFGSFAGGAIGALGSYLGTSQANAQSVKNMWSQAEAQSTLMNEQTTHNMDTMAYQNQLNQNNMREVMQYDTSMANTAYQRSVADMRAAGLNPILGVASGGASSPQPAAASVGALGTSSGSVSAPQNQSALGNAISSAMQGARLFSGIKEASANADLATTQSEQAERNKDDIAATIRSNAATASSNSIKAGADAATALAQNKAAERFFNNQADAMGAQAASSAKDAQLKQQQWSNNPSGPQVTVRYDHPDYIGGPSGSVTGTPAGVMNVGKSIFGSGMQYIAPRSPLPSATAPASSAKSLGRGPSTSTSTPSFAGFAPQSLFAAP